MSAAHRARHSGVLPKLYALHPLGLFHSRAGCRIFSKRCRLCDEPDTTPLVSRPRRSERFSTNTAIRLPSPYECHLPPRPQHHRLAIRLFDGMLMTVDATYPAHLLAREPAPPFAGEGPFALWHFSEDPSLGLFRPHVPKTNPDAKPLVWSIDTRHAPMFWFPRECPRGCIWPVSTTTDEDRDLFFGQSVADRVHVMESDWLPQMKACSLYAYRLPHESFRPHDVGGFWVSEEPVEALERMTADNLCERHRDARIELRVTPSLLPFWQRVVRSSVEFSGHRLQNASRHHAG